MEKFIVSARKYRPSTFASVVGQSHITSTLKNAIERGQLAHAYLFCGPRGVGKTTCARIFAKAINCLTPNGAEACDQCDSCRSFNENRSLNIHELDAASNNSVDDIRNLIEQVRVLPQIGRYSVFIIDEVHMLSLPAFNAFLKTLEEPPQHAIFILATTEKHKIIPTILSRCQIYDFNRIRVEDSVGYLRYIAQSEGVESDDESLNLIAQKADGGMRDALSMFDKAVSFCGNKLEYKAVAETLNILDYETYFRFTDMLLQGDYMSALIEYDNVLTKGFSGQIFMAGMNQHLRDLMMARGAGISLIEYTGTLLEKYRQQATKCDGAFLFGAISLLTEADAKLRTATSQRLLVELTLMKIAALAQKKNDDLELPAQPDYPLPELGERQLAPATVTPAPQPQPQVAPQPVQAQPVAQPQPAQPIVEQPKPQTPVTVQPQPTVVEEPKPIVVAEPKPQPQVEPQPQVAEQTQPQSQPQPKKKYASALGDSLADMLKRAGVSAEGGEATRVVIDRDSEAKLVQAKEEIISQMCKLRPRLVTAFEQISFKDNRVVLIVPTKVFEEELYAAKEDILANVASIAKVEGQLEMEVILREVKLDLTPLKFEDRIAHIRKVAPQFDALVKELDLVVDN